MIEDNDDSFSDNGDILDASGFAKPEGGKREKVDALEKEEREAAKKSAKPAPEGEYVVTCALKADGKKFNRGDIYVGKLYPGMIENGSLVSADQWTNR